MKNSNKTALLIMSLGLANGLWAQDADLTPVMKTPQNTTKETRFNIGPTVDLTLGDIHSSNLQSSLDAQRIIDPHITNWTSTSKLEPGIGIGAFATYHISKGLYLLGELTFGDEMSKYDLAYQNSTLNGNGNERIINVNSEFKMRTYGFQVPLLMKYEFQKENGVYILGGMRLSLITSATLESDETRTTDHYTNYILSERSVDNSSMIASMDGYSTARWSAVGGVGYKFAVGGHPLNLDFRVNLPLTRSGYYTTDVFYQNNAYENGQLFGAMGKTSAESQAPQYPLNDFRMFSFGLSASYGLFAK